MRSLSRMPFSMLTAFGWVAYTLSERTNTCLYVHALASADLQLLPSACPAAVAISWEGVDAVAEWMPEAKSADPCHPNASSHCPPPPHFPLSFPPSRAWCKHGIQFVTYTGGSGPCWPLHFSQHGSLGYGFLALFCERVNGKREQTHTRQ